MDEASSPFIPGASQANVVVPVRHTLPHPSFFQLLGGGLRAYFLQVTMLVEKNIKLSFQYWYFSIVKLILPALFIALLFGIQVGVNNAARPAPTTTPTPISHELVRPPKFVGNLFLFSVPSIQSSGYAIMQEFANKTGFTLMPPDEDPSFNYDIVYFDDEKVMLNYFMNHSSNIAYGGVRIAGDTSFTINEYIGTVDKFLGQSAYSNLNASQTSRFLTIDLLLQEARLTYRARQAGALNSSQRFSLDISYLNVPDQTGILDQNANTVWMFGAGVILFIGISVHTVILANQINSDRHQKMIQGLLMMGLQRGAYWASVFFTHAIFSLGSTWLMIFVGMGCKLDFFLRCNAFALFLIIFIGFLTANAAAIVLCALVHKPGGNMVLITLFLLGGVGFVATGTILTTGFPPGLIFAQANWLSYFFWQIHFGNVVSAILANTSLPDSPGFGLDNLYNESMWPGVIPKPATSLLTMFIQMIIFLILAWMMDNWWTGECHGIPQNFLFFIDPHYWGIIPNRKPSIVLSTFSETDQGSVLADMDVDVHQETNYSIQQNKVLDPDSMIRCLKLGKTFLPTSSKCCACCGTIEEHRALDSLSVVAERDEIFCLLGHNGAGKTSTINMITGMLAPTSGDAFICNMSILTDSNRIQKRIGVCCQHDILWPELTAREHIRLFCQLKGLPRGDWERIAKERLDLVKLGERAEHKVSTFSGGMKRRLSVAISTIGDPDVIFLDEPTTGLDLGNRMHLWGVIEQLKVGRCVFLTTHSMEEADRLADKIAILALGRLRAVGTSQRLKKRFGAGYHIQVVTESENVDVVKNSIANVAPSATLTTSETTGNLSYNVEAARLDALQKIFQYLETKSEQVPGAGEPLVQDWSISQTTLEEVFLRLTHGDVHTFKKQLEEESSNVQLLTIMLDGVPAGFVPVDMETTLDFVRSEVLKLEAAIPRDFVFVSNEIQLPPQQEKVMKAIAFIPSLAIQAASKGIEVDVNTQLKTLQVEIAHLKQTLAEKDRIIAELNIKLSQVSQTPQHDEF